jgi:hypothetical protein
MVPSGPYMSVSVKFQAVMGTFNKVVTKAQTLRAVD